MKKCEVIKNCNNEINGCSEDRILEILIGEKSHQKNVVSLDNKKLAESKTGRYFPNCYQCSLLIRHRHNFKL